MGIVNSLNEVLINSQVIFCLHSNCMVCQVEIGLGNSIAVLAILEHACRALEFLFAFI